jgi:hypothetical protein
MIATLERRPVPWEHHLAGVARPGQRAVGGVVLAQMVLAGGLARITMKTHRTDGRMSLVLQASRRHRLSGIPRQVNGDPLATGLGPLATGGDPLAMRGGPLEMSWSLLATRGDPLGTGWSLPVTGGDLLATSWDLVVGGGPLAMRGGPLEPIRDLVGEKPRFRIRAARHLQQRLSRKQQNLMRYWVEIGLMAIPTRRQRRLGRLGSPSRRRPKPMFKNPAGPSQYVWPYRRFLPRVNPIQRTTKNVVKTQLSLSVRDVSDHPLIHCFRSLWSANRSKCDHRMLTTTIISFRHYRTPTKWGS